MENDNNYSLNSELRKIHLASRTRDRARTKIGTNSRQNNENHNKRKWIPNDLSQFTKEEIEEEDQRMEEKKKEDLAFIQSRLGGKLNPEILDTIKYAHGLMLDKQKRYQQPSTDPRKADITLFPHDDPDFPSDDSYIPKWVQEAPGYWVDHNDNTGDLNLTRKIWNL